MLVGAWFSPWSPFAQPGVPQIVIRTVIPWRPALRTQFVDVLEVVARVERVGRVRGPRVGAIRDQYAVVRMIVAPVVAALSKFVARSSRQRKDGSSWNPTGILGAATAAAGATAASTSRQPRMSRVRVIWGGGSTGEPKDLTAIVNRSGCY